MSGRNSRVFILGWSTVCLFLTAFCLSSYSLFMPALLKDFPWTRAEVALPFSVTMFVWGVVQPISGIIADRRGTRPLILIGIVLMALGFAVMGTAQELWQVGIGFGLLIGVAISSCGQIVFSLLITKWFAGSRRATSAVGIVQAAVPVSPVIIAPILFYVITTFGWRYAALGLSAILLAVTLPLTYVTIQDPPAQPLQADSTETRKKGRGLLALLGQPAMRNIFISRIACGAGYLFAPHMAAAALGNGLTPMEASLSVSIYGAAATVGSFAGGMAADRWGLVPTLIVTYIFRGLGMFVIVLFPGSAFWFFLGVALNSAPLFATISINNVQIFELSGPKRAGLILGLSFVLHQIAGAIGPYVTGMVFDWTGSYNIPFLALGVFFLLAVIPAMGTNERAPVAPKLTPRPAGSE